MSASIYGALQWCSLTPDEITEVVDRITVDNIYNGEVFYHEVEKLDAWKPCTRIDDSVLIWNGDDAGQIEIDGKKIGLFVHYNEDEQQFDWACTYDLGEDLTDKEA